MVKKVTLSLLALLFLLRIVWYVVPYICHSPRFGSEAGDELQASSNATVRLGAGLLCSARLCLSLSLSLYIQSGRRRENIPSQGQRV